jgi:hypothetical protein
MQQRDSELAINYLMSAGVVAYQRAIAHAVKDALAGLLFSQLWYWAGRQPEDRRGWFFMTREQIFIETAMTRREQETSRRKLRELGILEEELRGHPAKLWYRINVQAVIQLIEKATHSQLGEKRPTRWYESAQLDGTKRTNKLGQNVPTSKISTKISSKTSAAASVQSATQAGEETLPAAADSLAKELIAQGVSRSVATRLAKEKPEVCRRCLEYLPFARYRTNPGAWLANAIRDEYGPPEGYTEAKRQEERTLAREKQEAAQKSRASHLDSLRREKLAKAREILARLENEQTAEAFLAFMGYVAEERRKAERMVAQLSAPRQTEYLSTFDAEEHRVVLFCRWLDEQGTGPEKAWAELGSSGPLCAASEGRGQTATPA